MGLGRVPVEDNRVEDERSACKHVRSMRSAAAIAAGNASPEVMRRDQSVTREVRSRAENARTRRQTSPQLTS